MISLSNSVAETKPLFSILIANYNNSRYLNQCLQSVIAQTYAGWEVIILDDGSTDNFDEVMRAYAAEQRIMIVKNGVNKGCAYTKMALADMANGDIVAFLDADDAIVPTALEELVQAHLEHPESSLIHSTHFVCDGQLQPLYVAPYPKALPPGVPYLLLSDGSIHHLASFKKRAYQVSEKLSPVRKFDQVGDQELYYLMEEQGSILFINKPLHYYRIHSGSISNWGNEASSTNAHHAMIVQQCDKRIGKLKKQSPVDHAAIRMYRTKKHRTLIISALRNRKWVQFARSIVVYPFVGGSDHFIQYIGKLIWSRKKTLRTTLHNYKIEVPQENKIKTPVTLN
jgi:glycosyltransferase involved in cell wall biosynthesis